MDLKSGEAGWKSDCTACIRRRTFPAEPCCLRTGQNETNTPRRVDHLRRLIALMSAHIIETVYDLISHVRSRSAGPRWRPVSPARPRLPRPQTCSFCGFMALCWPVSHPPLMNFTYHLLAQHRCCHMCPSCRRAGGRGTVTERLVLSFLTLCRGQLRSDCHAEVARVAGLPRATVPLFALQAHLMAPPPPPPSCRQLNSREVMPS